MDMSRTKNSLLNVQVALIGQALSLVVSFAARKVFVTILSAEYLGLSGLFSNILSMLSLAELGVGAAIIYSLYKPLAENNTEKIKSLMRLYQQAYTLIGTAIVVLGLSLTPFLSFFVKDLPGVPHIQQIYALFVLNAAASYFLMYKRSLIIADQKRYIDSLYHYCFFLLLNLLQIAALIVTRNYMVFLAMMPLCAVLENVFISRKAVKLYPYLKDRDVQKLLGEDRRLVFRNVRAMMFHKIGGVVVNGSSNLLLARFTGLVSVGLYSNYQLILQAFKTITGTLFQSFTASIGNLNVEAEASHKLEVFERLYFAGSWLFGFLSIGLLVMINPLIVLWLGEAYLFDFSIVMMITINFYVTGMRQACLTTRDAMGLYWYDRYKPLVESGINLVVSIALVQRLGVLGVFIGTFVSTMTTCFWVEPYVLYKYGLHSPVRGYFVRYAQHAAVTFIGALVTLWLCGLVAGDGYETFALKFMICVVVPNALYLACFWRSAEFKYFWQLFRRVTEKFAKR